MLADSGQELRHASLGRATEHLLQQHRVALTGAPGIGKTYEARGLLHAWVDSHGTAPTWVHLEEADEAEDILTACTQAAGMPHPAPSLLALGLQLTAAHRGHPHLLVLDGADRVASKLDGLLQALPRTHSVLVTSRRRVPGDIYNVPLEALELDAAVTLFLRRAEQQGGPVPESEIPVIRQICAALDGLPQAIELAATRTVVLSPTQLLQRMEQSLGVLRVSGIDEARDLYSTFDRSWSLLDPTEQSTLMQAAVFQSTFTVRDLEEVTQLAGGKVLDALHSLVAHSLVRSDREGPTVRFSIYRCLRHYVRMRMPTGDRVALEERHAEWALARSRHQVAELDSPRWVEARRTLRALWHDLHHIQATTDDLTTRVESRLLLAQDWTGSTRTRRCALLDAAVQDAAGTPAEHGARLARAAITAELGEVEVAAAELTALQRLPGGSPAAHRAAAQVRLELLHQTGSPKETSALADEVAEACVAAGDPLGEGRARHLQAISLRLGGRPAASMESLRAARSAFRRAEARRQCITVESTLCAMEADLGDYDTLIRDTERLVEVAEDARVHGDKVLAARLTAMAAFRWFRVGRVRRAIHDLTEATDVFLGMGNLHSAGRIEHAIGTLLHYVGALQEAEAHTERALDLCRDDPMFAADVRCDQLLLDLERGRDRDAVGRLDGVDWSRCSPMYRAYGLLLHALARRIAGDEDTLGAAIGEAKYHIGTSYTIPASSLQQVVTLLTAIVQGTTAQQPLDLSSSQATAGWHEALRAVAGPHGPAFSSRVLIRVLHTRVSLAEGQPACPLVLEARADGHTARVLGGPVVDLSRRDAPRRVLARLVEAHLEDPGQGLPAEAMFEAGWPGRRAIDKAIQSNVYTAIRTLRRQGLEGVLVTDGGYRLRPDLTLVRRP